MTESMRSKFRPGLAEEYHDLKPIREVMDFGRPRLEESVTEICKRQEAASSAN
jgi:hypothetical protein